MKKFFSKLAIVLALALVITSLAGAGTVKAAAKPKLSKSEKKLFIGGSSVTGTKEKFKLSVLNAPKKYSIEWKTSNAKVASVKALKGVNARVTAVGTGKATITCMVKDTSSSITYKLESVVKVKKNVSSIKLGDISAKDIAIGKEFTLTATQFDKQGNEVTKGKGTTDILKWASSNDKVATVDQNGKVKIVGNGSVSITAYTVQGTGASVNKLEKASAKASLSFDVIVEGMTAVSQKNLNTVAVEFGQKISDTLTKDNISVRSVLTNSSLPIKAVTFNDAGTIAYVTIVTEFTDNMQYNVVYGEDTMSFLATKGTPVALEIGTELNNLSVACGTGDFNTATDGTKLKFRLLNEHGVDITPLNEDSSEYAIYESRITYSTPVESSSRVGYLINNKVFIYKAGDALTVNAKYIDGTTTLTASAVISAVSEATTIKVDAVTIIPAGKTGASYDWSRLSSKIALADSGYKIVARAKNSDGKYIYSDDPQSKFYFEEETHQAYTLSPDGTIYPRNVGITTAIVKFGSDKTAIGTFNVEVIDKRYAQDLVVTYKGRKLTQGEELLVSSMGDLDRVDLRIKAYDQTGVEMAIGTGDVKVNREGSTGPYFSTAADNGEVVATAYPSGGSNTGTKYTYTISVGNSSTFVVTLCVINPVYGANSTWKVEVDGNFDLAVKSGATGTSRELSFSLYEMKNGVKYSKVSTLYHLAGSGSTGDYYYKLFVDGKEIAETSLADNKFVTVTANGQTHTFSKVKPGTYVLRVYRKTANTANGNSSEYVTETSFVLTDSQSVPSVSMKNQTTSRSITATTDSGTVLAIFNDCFTVALNGNIVDSTRIGIGTANTDYIVYVNQYNNIKQITFNYVYVNEVIRIGNDDWTIQHYIPVDGVVFGN